VNSSKKEIKKRWERNMNHDKKRDVSNNLSCRIRFRNRRCHF
jgi:hypothetical protein